MRPLTEWYAVNGLTALEEPFGFHAVIHSAGACARARAHITRARGTQGIRPYPGYMWIAHEDPLQLVAS